MSPIDRRISQPTHPPIAYTLLLPSGARRNSKKACVRGWGWVGGRGEYILSGGSRYDLPTRQLGARRVACGAIRVASPPSPYLPLRRAQSCEKELAAPRALIIAWTLSPGSTLTRGGELELVLARQSKLGRERLHHKQVTALARERPCALLRETPPDKPRDAGCMQRAMVPIHQSRSPTAFPGLPS